MATYTYTQDPSSSLKDEVRFLTQDTNMDDALMGDEEIAYLLTKYANDPILTAIAALNVMLINLSSVVNSSKEVGDLKLSSSAGDRFKNLSTAREGLIAQSLRLTPATPYAGGITIADKSIDEENDGLVNHEFSIGQDDFPGTTRSNAQMYSRVVPG